MEEWYREVGQLQSQVATIPQQTQVQESVAGRQAAVEARMVRLIEPLKERRRLLLASKEVHQVRRDLEDEIVRLVEIPLVLFARCVVVGLWVDIMLLWFPVVDSGAPADGHVPRARLHSSGSATANEEKPGKGPK